MNPQYMQAAERYIQRLAAVVRPLLVTREGPIVLLQIENEYGNYGNDRAYMARLRAGTNEVVVFDLHKMDASPLRGAPALE